MTVRTTDPSFPTPAGTYKSGSWRYVYSIQNTGTRSERRVGELYKGDHQLEGEPGEMIETPLGKFVQFYFHYNWGWLNTLTYDRPVFTAGGALTDDAHFYLRS